MVDSLMTVDETGKAWSEVPQRKQPSEKEYHILQLKFVRSKAEHQQVKVNLEVEEHQPERSCFVNITYGPVNLSWTFCFKTAKAWIASKTPLPCSLRSRRWLCAKRRFKPKPQQPSPLIRRIGQPSYGK